ncbi:HD domain-containing protein [Thioalkalivibrio sp. HK1]|uniref:HD domain-containing protein n=1 Tax=Thioalkalivibrio sp. HK1 TaxID=1469245 RepID=UPI0018CC1F58|nr:HD domain-containing protein [Thioalkalivibrio sp. HK1]
MMTMRTVSYTRMDEGTVEDYALGEEIAKPFMNATPDRILAFMECLHDTFPGGRIDRYAHSLQTATRAEDAGECEEFVVAALLHDIGDSLAPHNHADVGADILRPYVSRHTHWMLKHHGIFQGYYYWDKIGKNRYERERYRDHPAYEMTVRFTGRYDQMAFDPGYETRPIEHFEPMLRRIFARVPWGAQTKEDWPVVDRAGP